MDPLEQLTTTTFALLVIFQPVSIAQDSSSSLGCDIYLCSVRDFFKVSLQDFFRSVTYFSFPVWLARCSNRSEIALTISNCINTDKTTVILFPISYRISDFRDLITLANNYRLWWNIILGFNKINLSDKSSILLSYANLRQLPEAFFYKK